MDELTFNKKLVPLNKAYFDIFGEIPSRRAFDCSRDQYVNALQEAIRTKQPINTLLPEVIPPAEKDALW